MKIVIISVPAIVSDADIKEAAIQFAATLDMSGLKCNILGKDEITLENPSTSIHTLLESIISRCKNDNPTTIIANFWRMVSMGEISKQSLLKLTTGVNRVITKRYLDSKGVPCFLKLFDEALKMM